MKKKQTKIDLTKPEKEQGFVGVQSVVRFSDDDIETIMNEFVDDGLVYQISDGEKIYKIYVDGELIGFGKDAKIEINGFLPKVTRLRACLKEIQRIRLQANRAKQDFSE